MSRLIWDSDDFGANHIISDMCQTHDCRDVLDKLHEANPKFKATLFTVPGETTLELLSWAAGNKDWIELAYHGFYHTSNYECEKMSYKEFDTRMQAVQEYFGNFFVKGFKAPGWQISDHIYGWLKDNGYWIADQSYNNDRRPKDLKAYVNNNGIFNVCYNGATSEDIPASHHHTWNTVNNGVYEQFDYILDLIKDVDEFKFVSEIIDEKTQIISGEVRNGG